MSQDSYQLDVENSFIFFLITLQKLRVSSIVQRLLLKSDMTLKGFVYRNKAYLRKAAILIL